MTGEFAGKVVVVTGAAGNLGSAVVRAAAAEGARVVLVERSPDKAEKLAAEIGGETLTVLADLGVAASVDQLIETVVARFGQIDVLAHTVGGFESGATVHGSDYDAMERMLNLNLRPVYITCGKVAQHMIDKGITGRIVVVLARGGLKGFAGGSAYTASKAAAQRVVESLAAEVRDKGIHVNAIMPSTIDTPPNRASMPNADFSKWVTPEEAAQAILFLASERGSAFYGTSLEVYGRA